MRTKARCWIPVLLGFAMAFAGARRGDAHDGHRHEPAGAWSFYPIYQLPGRAGAPVPDWMTNSLPVPAQSIELPALWMDGERPSHRLGPVSVPGGLQIQAFSVELWLLDHVNRPVGAMLAGRGAEGREDPGWMLGYRDGRVRFRLHPSARDTAIELEARSTNAFKRYWHHVVGTYDGERATLYLNGRAVAHQAGGGTVRVPANALLEMAAFLASEPHMEFANLVRDVRFYSDDIGPTQVAARFEELSRLVAEGRWVAEQFHFTAGPLITHLDTNAVQVTWETDRPSSGTLRLGTKWPGDRSLKAEGASRLHSVLVTGLEPGRAYFYEITAAEAQGTGEIRSGLLAVRTAPIDDSPIAFAVLGDTEARPHINNVLAKAIWGERPQFALLVGDLTDGGQRDHWFQWTHEYFAGMNQILGRIPFFTVPGNGESDLHWYNHYHRRPGRADRYAFRFGDAEFFMLDSNRPMGPGSEQFAWLDGALAASRARWKFVAHHHPCYSSDEDDYGDAHRGSVATGDENPRSAVALYEKYGVDIVFYGHIHAYERTWPLKEGRVAEQGGVRYVQTGGGGGNLEDFAPVRNEFSRATYRGHHYCVLHLHAGQLQFRMVDDEGRLRDAFEIRK